ncbi:MAG TPA: hypothetical protein VFQ53_26720 [Kofleriaceae bacterium]|nr:hypothetical protein [Kofleriaceae bacterium]
MGSKLAFLAAQLIVVIGIASHAHADNPKAKELFKKGVDEYKAQKYDAAAATLKQSYELDPKPESLFALAQAERLGGKCPAAIAHYKQLLEQTTDLPTAKAVQSNMSLCPGGEPERPKPDKDKDKDDKDEAKQLPPPTIETRTVVREVGRTDKVGVAMVAGGMLGLGVGGAMFLAASGNQSDADKALTLDDHQRLLDRAGTQRIISYAALGAGAGMLTYGIVRFVRGGKETPAAANVAISPTSGGGLVSLSSRW